MDPEAPAVLSLGSNRIQVQTCSIGESLSRNVPFANLTKRQICGSFSFLSNFLSPFKHWTIGMLSRRKTGVGFGRVSNEFQRVPRKDLRVWKHSQSSKEFPSPIFRFAQHKQAELLLPMLHQRKSLDNGNAKAAGGDEEDNLNFSGPPWQQLSWRHLNCIKTGSQIAPGEKNDGDAGSIALVVGEWKLVHYVSSASEQTTCGIVVRELICLK